MRNKYHIYTILTLVAILLSLGHFTKSLAQQPSQQTNPQASQTTIIYQFPLVKFRLDSGDDLDLYLYGTSSPLDFYIDLQGFKPHPDKPATVTLKVWDIDETGNPTAPHCLTEVDEFYVNNTYLGRLSGANNQWSEITFNLPSKSLSEGVNHFWIEIDTLTPDCWAVEVDWAEVAIPFNMAQVEASTYYDVKIKRGTSDDIISDPIWQREFDSNGNITLATPNDPIADKITGSWFFDWGAREFV